MRFHFRATRNLLDRIRDDLARPHRFAWERVGFMRVGLASGDEEILILGADYRPVPDEHYLANPDAGASIGREAIREALEWADTWHGGIFHVHAHRGTGIPFFSSLDLDGNERLIPTFFNIAPHRIHGALVLSDDRMFGAVWTGKTESYRPISRMSVIGTPMTYWSAK